MPLKKKIVALLTLVGLTFAAPIAADEFDTVRERIRARMSREQIPSVVVGVARRGKVIWSEAFGWADRENRVPATVTTAYRIGSGTKPITATAIMALADEGKLKLDQPINELLGHAKVEARTGDVKEATLRTVLQHTSGLPGHWETFFPDESASPPPVDLLIARYGKLMMPPGAGFHYSNLGYAILGHIVSRSSGKEFAEFLREEVFVPLGMTQSFLAVGDFSQRKRAVGYRANGDRGPDIVTCIPGAGDVYSTVGDLLRFGRFHLKLHSTDQKPLLSDATIDKMQHTRVPMGKEEYGLGWHLRTDASGRRHVLHGGAHVGWECHFEMIPEEKLCVAVLANKDVKWPGYRICLEVADLIFATLLGVPIEDVQPKGGHSLGLPSDQPSGLPGPLKGRWTGTVHTYKRDLPVKLWFKDNGDVHAQIDDQLVALVNEARYEEKTFTGKMSGDIGTESANRRNYTLDWHLTFRNQELSGILYATGRDSFGTPGRGLLLAHWVELRAQSGGASQ